MCDSARRAIRIARAWPYSAQIVSTHRGYNDNTRPNERTADQACVIPAGGSHRAARRWRNVLVIEPP
jgi:hypothetical protein